ncbi:UDP-N-acetylmuramoyl-tripeptide--D-alanyl-D-alanine ligase [Candidatus Parcubacteria bacterium]|nr:UDP-N-acetylmuramoyl-tripeptide--D-alanyl-D-alanine ligase [Patescibacteria group bacterium]MBU4308979.1 UDP-N-acetylmuramoyl-tripeptide--D-alanyl-D-alanine ligase [Patescibacteria group bacterium]MBU4431706.1 UDP-N-acetylmuramoyl-tripeptide--D-alanyl-D-alanine ligase [Patescibacteria group bacterium]MBU4577339.1 UDP-N-acetylmuramoyl-tripeptide--D-alanyl-D-alanine ligase [Patescibacteria group bacterium]MCG2697027.1 UDP-N-acetylmuramoyl-tripeptide--D-alanyl-D-alanine ligase [Candidatus Parcu
MKKLLQLKLKILSQLILKKYQPKVIGITGSVGKTTTKEAVYAVLKDKFKVRRNIKNYNNEIGLPLTIIGVESPGKNLFGWLGVFWKAVFMILIKDKDYPEVLILEMGIDRPGDMMYLNEIANPSIAIVTAVGNVHLEYFGSRKKLQKEKADLVRVVPKEGLVVLNFDNELVREMKKDSRAKVVTFGMDPGADLNCSESRFSFEGGGSLQGISFKIKYNGSTVPFLIPGVIGFNSIYAAMAAIAVATNFGMNMVEIASRLKEFRSPQGRMNLLKGIKNTSIIDDTYNSEPVSCVAGLDVLGKFAVNVGAKKFAVLGDMLELGQESVERHREIGEKVKSAGVNVLITVGERSRDIDHGAIEAGMKTDNVFHFNNSEEAGLFVQEKIRQGDLIFVKGSQGVRMEKVVKEIMAEPLRAEELLVRQDKEWGNK